VLHGIDPLRLEIEWELARRSEVAG
jgi:hypothetical protein